MKVKLKCKDGVIQTHYINPKNYDPLRMKIIENKFNYRALDRLTPWR